MEDIKIFNGEYLKECSKIYPSIFNEEPWSESWTEDRSEEHTSGLQSQ